MKRITVIGVGRMGGALAIALARAGFIIEQLVYRSQDSFERISAVFAEKQVETKFFEGLKLRETDIFLIATSDPEIPNIAAWLSKTLGNPAIVIHTSGSLSSDVLFPLADIGCQTGSMHPLISVSDSIAGSSSFSGAYFCTEGDPAAVLAANEIISALSAKPLSIPTENKVLYHAAAVIACGHLSALIEIASDVMKLAGISDKDRPWILMPLIESTIANIKANGTAAALTGSFARADAETVSGHMAALGRSVSRETIDLYRILGNKSLDLAAERGVDADRIEAVRKVLLTGKCF